MIRNLKGQKQMCSAFFHETIIILLEPPEGDVICDSITDPTVVPLYATVADSNRHGQGKYAPPLRLARVRSSREVGATFLVVAASGCQCQSRNSHGFHPSILQHRGI